MPSYLVHCTRKCQRVRNTGWTAIASWNRGVWHERLQVRFPLLTGAHNIHFSCGSLIKPCLYDFPAESYCFRCVDDCHRMQSFDIVVLIDFCDMIQELCWWSVEKSEIPTRSIDHDTVLLDTACVFSGKWSEIHDRTLCVKDMISHKRCQRCLSTHFLYRTCCTHIFEDHTMPLKVWTRNSDRMSRRDNFRITFEYVFQTCHRVS